MEPKSTTPKESHRADIMSVCYDPKTFILFTGGHDGTIFGWNMDTSSIKYHLHAMDDDCISKTNGVIDPMLGVKKSKSVDCMEIISVESKNIPENPKEEPKTLRLLCSGSANQCIRFWNIDKMPAKPLVTLDIQHGEHGPINDTSTKSFWGESLTAFRATTDGTLLVTGDTAG